MDCSSKCSNCNVQKLEVDRLRGALDVMRGRAEAFEKVISNLISHGGGKTHRLENEAEVKRLRLGLEAIKEIVDNALKQEDYDEDTFRQLSSLIQKINRTVNVEPCMIESEIINLENGFTYATHTDSPLKNPLVIGEIAKMLPLKDLFNCRLVNSKWNEVVQMIIRHNHLRNSDFSFSFDKMENSYTSNKGREMKEFNDCFKNSQRLPFTSFVIADGSLTTPDIKSFLSLFGQCVNKLTLNMGSSPCLTTTTLSNLLVNDLPNLEHLIIDSTPHQWKACGAHLFPENDGLVKLPNLKKLKFEFDVVHKQILCDIMRVAVNLREVEDVGFNTFPLILSTNKLHCLSHFIFNPIVDEQMLERCKRLAEAKPQLTELVVILDTVHKPSYSKYWAEIGDCLREILISSRNTLKKIHIGPCAFLSSVSFSRFRLPVLETVQGFHLIEFNHLDEDNQIFPSGQALGIVCPNVSQVSVNMVELKLDQKLFDDLFPNDGQLSSVKILKLISLKEENFVWIGMLATHFPNIEKLYVDCVLEKTPKLLKIIWSSFSNVTTVEIELDINETPEEDFCLEMDSAITGFSEETCTDLSTNSRTMTIQDMDNLREGPSLLDMKKLKELTFCFNFEHVSWPTTAFHRLIFSHVTGIFGFRAIKLQQNIYIAFKSDLVIHTTPALEFALDPVLNHVNVEWEYFSGAERDLDDFEDTDSDGSD